MPGGRVLMIAHHFPPAGGSGANRALAFARYLPESDWTPIVVTPGVAWASNRDDQLTLEVPPGVRVIRTSSWESRPTRGGGSAARGGGRRTLPRVRSHLGHLKRFPDAHLGWLPFALAAARRVNYNVAYSSSGPFTSHLVGLLLKKLSGRPWVAELRDGWYRWNRAIFPDYPAWRDALERRLESAALRTADRVVLVTERMADAYRCHYADLAADHFAVVPNGFDPEQFGTQPGEPRSGWEVLHAGALYYGRSVASFLEAAKRVTQEDAEFASEFRLTLVGTLDTSARDEVSSAGLAQHLQIRAQLDHASTIQAMRGANVLLLVANTTPGAEATVPGKLFEYLAARRPVLAITAEGSSTADVLAQTGGGWLAAPGDPAAIACVLRRAFLERSKTRGPDPDKLARFDRRVLAGDLARILDQAVDHAARRA